MLRRVAEQEEIEAPDAAIGLIARHATGSFRDALGTLEQLVTYGGPKIELDTVLEIMGAADAELVLDTAEALIDHDPKGVLLAVEKLSASGRDIAHFMRDLSEHLRHLFVVQTLGEVPATFAVTAEHTDRLNAQADRLPQAEVLRAIDLLARARSAVKDGSEPRIQLELALLKAVQPQSDLSIQALLFRIEQLERKLEVARAARERAASAPRARGPAAILAAARAARGRRRRAAPQAVAVPEEAAGGRARHRARRAACGRRRSTPCARENAMVAALLGEARPSAIAGSRAHGQLPRGRRVLAQEGRREPRAAPDGAARPDRPLAGVTFDLGAPPPGEGEPLAADVRGRAARAPQGRVQGRGSLRRRRRDLTMPQPPNMNQMLKQVQQMQAEMAKAQEELKNERVEATAGGGTVKVVMTGELQVVEVQIDPDAVDPDDVELLQDLVLAAFNEALRSAQELQQRKLGAATGGLGDLAGGLGLPGL